ncbi:MAG: thiamine pyrophosphate-binding protein [Rhodopseudomonas palustris]|nr:thiamine pyrophosphate-binding protein [Rhodopseudomonas palustris]
MRNVTDLEETPHGQDEGRAMAAVLVMEKEGITQAFGVPGAAINPLYAALRERGTIAHVLARHVEGASHMAEGYTRAQGRQHRRVHRHLRPGRHRHDHRPVFGAAPTRSRSCASPARRRARGCTRRTSRRWTSSRSPSR